MSNDWDTKLIMQFIKDGLLFVIAFAINFANVERCLTLSILLLTLVTAIIRFKKTIKKKDKNEND